MSEIKVNSIKGVGATTAAITVNNSDGTCTANITNNLSNRNKVINGAMLINQRSSSYTDTGTEYLLDRFQHRVSGSLSFDTTTTQDTSSPDDFSKSLKITPDSTQTPSGGDNGVIETKLEGQDVQSFAHGTSSAKAMTISFYAKSASQNNNAIYSFQVIKVDVGGSSGKYVLQPFTVTSNWQRFTFTFTGDTSTAIIDGNVKALRLVWNLSSGPDDLTSATTSWTSGDYWRGVTGMSNFMDNTSNEFYLTGVQLEVGSVATDFEHRSYNDEYLRSCRYYQSTTTVPSGSAYNAMAGHGGDTYVQCASAGFKTLMRANPTTIIYNGTDSNKVRSSGGANVTLNSPTVYAMPHGINAIAVSSGLSDGEWYQFNYTCDAEL